MSESFDVALRMTLQEAQILGEALERATLPPYPWQPPTFAGGDQRSDLEREVTVKVLLLRLKDAVEAKRAALGVVE